MENQYQFSENDVVCIQPKREPDGAFSLRKALNEPRASGPGSGRLLGKVESLSTRHDQHRVVVRIKIPVCLLSAICIATQSPWTVQSVFSLSTAIREYQAMIALPSCTVHRDILEGRIRSPQQVGEREVRECAARYQVNDSQARAILSAVKMEEGFLLIQGPPGSGKTKTILGLVAASIEERRARAAKAKSTFLQAQPPVKFRSGSSHGRTDGGGEGANAAGASAGASDAAATPAPVEEKILICAPSNAAVDEILRRLKDGIPDGRGGTFTPKMVRLGQPSSVHADVKQFMLEYLMDADMSVQSRDLLDIEESVEALRRKLDALHKKRDAITLLGEMEGGGERKQLATMREQAEVLETAIRDVHKKMAAERQRKAGITNGREKERRAIKTRILNQVDIVLTTLAGAAGHEMLANRAFTFPTVIVDEACQSAELTCLVPLRHGARKVLMIGDPQQLPPTILSRSAIRLGYDVSLFQRMMTRTPQYVHMLGIQYRMHPEISQFPRSRFYHGKLQDAQGMDDRTRAPWHESQTFPPYLVFDVKGGCWRGARGARHLLVFSPLSY